MKSKLEFAAFTITLPLIVALSNVVGCVPLEPTDAINSASRPSPVENDELLPRNTAPFASGSFRGTVDCHWNLSGGGAIAAEDTFTVPLTLVIDVDGRPSGLRVGTRSSYDSGGVTVTEVVRSIAVSPDSIYVQSDASVGQLTGYANLELIPFSQNQMEYLFRLYVSHARSGNSYSEDCQGVLSR